MSVLFKVGVVVSLLFLLSYLVVLLISTSKQKFHWKSGEWGECQDNNQQTRSVTCVNDKNQTVGDSKCQSPKPAVTQPCGNKWTKNGEWGECNGRGFQLKSFSCPSDSCLNSDLKLSDVCQKCTPKWPDNVYFFEHGNDQDTQKAIYDVFKTQGGKVPDTKGQFSKDNYAFLFCPGEFTVDVPIGYYTQVCGLGKSPSEVTLNGGPRVNNGSNNFMIGALDNFWRSCENMTVNPDKDKPLLWAVSQATSLRSVHVNGDIKMGEMQGDNMGYASGGFMANVQCSGVVDNGSQQQFLCRNTEMTAYKNPNWNAVLVGCSAVDPPTSEGHYLTQVPRTPRVAEKPYLVGTGPQDIKIYKPTLQTDRKGVDNTPPLEKTTPYLLAVANKTTLQEINDAFKQGHDVLLTPGTYQLEGTIILSGQLLFGLGVPRLINTTIKGHGSICGIIVQAGTDDTQTLVNLSKDGPSMLWDVYCRVGGGETGEVGKAKTMIQCAGDNSILDNVWCWAADHYADGSYTFWENAACDVGVHVKGDNVTAFGLFAEHNHGYNVLWEGNNGATYMFQSEFNYFPPNQDSFGNAVSYKVGDNVFGHTLIGGGAYSFFPCSSDESHDVYAAAGFDFGHATNVNYQHLFTVFLNGFGGIHSVVKGKDTNRVGWTAGGSNPQTFYCQPTITRAQSKIIPNFAYADQTPKCCIGEGQDPCKSENWTNINCDKPYKCGQATQEEIAQLCCSQNAQIQGGAYVCQP